LQVIFAHPLENVKIRGCQSVMRADYGEIPNFLEIREKALGPDHPDVASSLSSLGELYYSLRRYTQAESLFKRALEIREKVFGLAHPKVAITLHNFASWWDEQGYYMQAEILYKRSLAILEKNTSYHINMTTALNNLAKLYRATNRIDEAEKLELQVANAQ
jgi:tetratricopeptide (TPR) repeat protein